MRSDVDAGNDSALDGKLLISVNGAARALSLSVRTINSYTATKRLLSRKIGRRRLVVVSSLRAFASKDHDGMSPWSGATKQESDAL
jgi:hypothetical protein